MLQARTPRRASEAEARRGAIRKRVLSASAVTCVQRSAGGASLKPPRTRMRWVSRSQGQRRADSEPPYRRVTRLEEPAGAAGDGRSCGGRRSSRDPSVSGAEALRCQGPPWQTVIQVPHVGSWLPRLRQKVLILELIQRPRTRLGEGFQGEAGLFRGLLLHPSAAGGLDAPHGHGQSPAR